MRNQLRCCVTLLALVLVVVLIQAPSQSETLKIKKVKKVIKDAAKLSKKYGYLLASRKNKLYAIPFPMPLPIFVKRQHIYTQVPIIPRYVQHPQQYGSPSLAMAESGGYNDPMASMQTSVAPSMSSGSSSYYGGSQESPGQRRKKNAAGYSSSSSSSSAQKYPSSSEGSSDGNSAITTATKYLGQLANFLSQSAPMLGNTGGGSGSAGSSGGTSNRELLTKLLNGQAKVMSPTSFISAIKGPSAALLKYKQQADASQQDQDYSKNEASSDGSSGSTGSPSSNSDYSNNDNNSQGSSSSSGPINTTKPPGGETSSSYEANRPSASEIYRSRYRSPYGMASTGGFQGPAFGMQADMRRIPMAAAMMSSPMMSPLAAMAAASQGPGQLMPRIPISKLAAANQYLAMLDSQANTANQLDQLDSQSSEPNELTAGLSHPHQQQRQSQQSLAAAAAAVAAAEEQTGGPGAGASAGIDHSQQLLERRRQLLKLALLKERQEAERLLESRAVLARAKQISQQLNQLPAAQQQAMQLMSLYRQQQTAQQLQQLRYLQLLHQQQQQLQQNTIDYQ